MSRKPIAIISTDPELAALDARLEQLRVDSKEFQEKHTEVRKVIWLEIEKTLDAKGLTENAKDIPLEIKDGVIYQDGENGSTDFSSIADKLRGVLGNISR